MAKKVELRISNDSHKKLREFIRIVNNNPDRVTGRHRPVDVLNAALNEYLKRGAASGEPAVDKKKKSHKIEMEIAPGNAARMESIIAEQHGSEGLPRENITRNAIVERALQAYLEKVLPQAQRAEKRRRNAQSKAILS